MNMAMDRESGEFAAHGRLRSTIVADSRVSCVPGSILYVAAMGERLQATGVSQDVNSVFCARRRLSAEYTCREAVDRVTISDSSDIVANTRLLGWLVLGSKVCFPVFTYAIWPLVEVFWSTRRSGSARCLEETSC